LLYSRMSGTSPELSISAPAFSIWSQLFCSNSIFTSGCFALNVSSALFQAVACELSGVSYHQILKTLSSAARATPDKASDTPMMAVVMARTTRRFTCCEIILFLPWSGSSDTVVGRYCGGVLGQGKHGAAWATSP